MFDELEANDILFVDSSHVSKVGSDVNHVLFNVLPASQTRRVDSLFMTFLHPFVYP